MQVQFFCPVLWQAGQIHGQDLPLLSEEDPNLSLPVIHPPTSTATPYQDNRPNESCVSRNTDTGDHESCHDHSHNEVIIIWYLLYIPIYNLVELLIEIFAFCYCHFFFLL